jgi:hypothetical protein
MASKSLKKLVNPDHHMQQLNSVWNSQSLKSSEAASLALIAGLKKE